MSHDVNLGALKLVKESGGGICKADTLIISGTGIQTIQISVPNNKIWIIQQLSLENNTGASKNGLFYLTDESDLIIGFLSMKENPQFTITDSGYITFVGTGFQYVPQGWKINVDIFNMAGVGVLYFNYHVTEIDIA